MKEQNEILKVTTADFARLFGTNDEEVEALCGSLIEKGDFRYQRVAGEARDTLILQALEKIFAQDLAKAGTERQRDWENGWRENLNEFIASDNDLTKLIPKYFKKEVPARLNLEYVKPFSSNFVFDYTHVYRTWIFKKFLSSAEAIYEFGCGPAYHLAYLAQLFPQKKLVGLDWAHSSQEIIKVLVERYGWNIHGRKFDFFHPDPNLTLSEKSAVFTFGALEQIGEKHEAFLEFILNNRPVICVNVECLQELYDPHNLLSFLALQYHKKRNYLSGYLSKLRECEQKKKIKIMHVHYHKFCNLFDEALSYVIWKPL
jgi:hypothetical protein